jgi:hypothetical protein
MSAIEAHDGVESSRLAPCDAPPPLALRLIAYVFILAGVLGITEMIVRLLCSRGLIFDIGWLIWILTGRGLLRWRNGWRRWAVFCGWLALIMALATVAIAILDMRFGLRHGPLSGIVAGTLLGLGAWWVMHVLQRPDIAERFRSPPALHARRPWQFSLGTLMVAMVFVAFVAARVCSDDVRYRVAHHGPRFVINSDGASARWTYGTRMSRFWDRPPELLYAILHGENPPFSVWQSSSGESGLKSADGEEIELPRGNQLFELNEGRITPRDGRVSLEEFEDYLERGRANWSVEGLLEHARQMREKTKAEAAK